jgi:phosphoribosylamine--glycine ligase
MKILVIGSGGREHALAWKLKQSAGVDEVLVAPGNAGSAMESGVRNINVAATDISALIELSRNESIDFTVVGPEAPLVAGAVDAFTAAGFPCFGPTAQAAQLEGSKAFSKDFMQRYGIPTAAHETFSDAALAKAYVSDRGAPIVIKADGLAAGKGVIVAQTQEQACAAIDDMLSGSGFGEAGHRVVVEEFLPGEEASFICLCDGSTPAPVVTPEVHERAMSQVIMPTLNGMAAEGTPYRGFLYAGLMISPEGEIKVVEFNCRFGDPEAQPVMMRLQSDLLPALQQAAAGKLQTDSLRFDSRVALGVVMAAGGYPADYESGDVITGLDKNLEDTKVFHAGTKLQDEAVVTAGGRVLCVVGVGDSVEIAQVRAYERIESIGWRNRYFRKDIGYRAVGREAGH